MHSKHFNSGSSIHYNSDLSGDVLITGEAPGGEIEQVKIDGNDLVDFVVVQKLGTSIIEDVESMTGLELLAKITKIAGCVQKCPEIIIWKEKTRKVIARHMAIHVADEITEEIFNELC